MEHFTRTAIRPWACVLQATLAAIITLQASATLADGRRDIVDRQVLLVLDQRADPPRATSIVNRETSRAGVAEVLALFEGAEAISRLGNIDDTSKLETLRAVDPLSPELLSSEYLLVTLKEDQDVATFLEDVRKHRWVLSVERNYRLEFSGRYTDPGASANLGTYQWGFTSSSPLNFSGAWAKLRGTAYIAAIDNGVYWMGGATHPDLASGFRPHYSRALPYPSVPLPPYVPLTTYFEEQYSTDVGHGTHVMGLLIADDAGAGNGVTGACPGCSAYMYRIDQSNLTADYLGLALNDAIRSGAQIVNLSLGIRAYDPFGYKLTGYCSANPSTYVCVQLALATTRGVSIVASSGNKKTALDFPANQPSVIAAGGLEKDSVSGVISFFTNGYQNPSLGPCPLTLVGTGDESGSSCSDSDNVSNAKYQFLAPAKDVLSTFYFGATYREEFNCGDQYDPYSPSHGSHYNHLVDGLTSGYGTCTGTSMSAPILSGIVGLMRSANPLLNAGDIHAILKRRSSGGGTPISNHYGWGIPSAADAVTAALSGASAANPDLYNSSIVNKTTPLFSLYSTQGKNHFYTIYPQMAAAAFLGSLKPAPTYTVVPSQWTSPSCTPPCNSLPIGLPSVQVKNPDGSNAGVNAGVISFVSAGLEFNAVPDPNYSISNSLGVASPQASWKHNILDSPRPSLTFSFAADTPYPLNYTPRGNTVSGYSLFPGITTIGVHPRTLINVYVSHVNPIGGPAMVPLYRLSRKCGEFSSPVCTPGNSSYNPFHVGHAYTTSSPELGSLTSAPHNFRKDGIEGYVFPTSYSNAPIAGAVRLCRLVDPVRDEAILFPGTGNGGKSCNPPFPDYASGSYYSGAIGSTDWLGWIVPNFSGNTPPTVSLSSPPNGSTFSLGSAVTLSATASDSNGIANVKWFANGVQVASDSSSPYSKTWTPPTAGVYKLYAMATDSHGSPLQATSNSRDITVGSCAGTIPTVNESGFEAPVLPAGTYDDAPASAFWSFVAAWGGGQSGISTNGSPFTSFNPNAPAGVQVGYIQGENYIRQTINFPTCGTYRLRASLAQRAVSNYSFLNLHVDVDGVDYGSLYGATNPLGLTNYLTFTSAAFTVAAGPRVITLRGVNPHPAQDNSIFIDSVQMVP